MYNIIYLHRTEQVCTCFADLSFISLLDVILLLLKVNQSNVILKV